MRSCLTSQMEDELQSDLVKPIIKEHNGYQFFLFAKQIKSNVDIGSFDCFPPELLHHIFDCKSVLDKLFTQALQHAAFGEFTELKLLLDQCAYLVLMRGNVITPGGLLVKNTTLLECVIGACDWAINKNSPGMAEMILEYFDKLPNGENERIDQLKRCKPCIYELKNQKPYDLKKLLSVIKKADEQDVIALNMKFDTKSYLCEELKAFRNDVRPGIITQPALHYNYQTLIDAFDLFFKEWSNLTTYQQRLFWRQVIGYLQRSLPAVDRFIFARLSIYNLIEKNRPLERNLHYHFKKIGGDDVFPIFVTRDTENAGLGFDYGLSAIGNAGELYLSKQGLIKLQVARITMFESLMEKYGYRKKTNCLIS